jgi:hypothetical protein
VALNYNMLNYCLNKFCPYLIIFLLLFWNSALNPWKGAVIFLACLFADKFSFRAGFSLAYCEAKGIDLNKDVE